VILRATDDEQAWEVTSTSPATARGSYPVAAPLRIRIDAFDPQGPARVTGTATANVTCRRRDGLDRRATSTFGLAGEQDVSPGAQVERSVGAERDLDRATLERLCGTDTLIRASIAVRAVGHTVSGVTIATPTATFDAVF
jgi:hypothetical protein